MPGFIEQRNVGSVGRGAILGRAQLRIVDPDTMEIVVTPQTTHLLMEHIHDSRRIYTDGRGWPEELEPAFRGH